jgi:tetratricopeptide (TPR) repeat protein
LWAFLPAIQNDFVGYDDPVYVTDNPHVRQGLTLADISWAFAATEAGNWHPLTWLSHQLDVSFFGMKAGGHHFTSILLHALNTALLFAALQRLTGDKWLSFIGALLFGLHPLRVESVAWVAERKDVLSASFWMLMLWGYARYAQPKVEPWSGRSQGTDRGSEPHRRVWYCFTLGFFGLGLMCKPMLVSAPFALLLLDYWPLARWKRARWKELVMEKIPFFALSALFSVATFIVQQSSGAVLTTLPLSDRVANAAISYCRYLGKLFWPVNLAAFYPPIAHWPTVAVALASALLLGISALAFAWRTRRPYVLVGWLWFIGTLVPVIGLVQAGEQSMADRYSYIPSIGIVLLVVWGFHEVRKSWRLQVGFAAAVLLPVTIVCFVLTREQISVWRNSETLFRHALAVTSANYLAHNNLGTALEKRGLLGEAIEQFQEALQDKPGYGEAHKNLGVALEKNGQTQEALKQFLLALEINPGDADAHSKLGTALQRMGRFDEARKQFEEAIKLKPDFADAHYNLAVVLQRTGAVDEAVVQFQETLRLQPDSADAHLNLGFILQQKGQLDEGIAHYRAALEIRPDYPRAHFNLGVALSAKGSIDGAIAEFREALRLRSDYPEARTNLAILLEFQRQSPTNK